MSNISDILRLPDRELWLVTSGTLHEPAGLIATFVNNASIVPELSRVIVGIAKQHHTWKRIEACHAFVLHLLDESHIDWVWRFGLQTGHAIDKFAGLETTASATGCPRLAGAVAWLDCKVETSMDTGDRTIYLAEALDGRLEKRTPLLTLKRLLQSAPADRLGELRDGMTRDAAIDAAAIRAWRRS